MIYLERTPSPPLRRFVRLLWYARVPQASHSRERVLPSGASQIIVNLAREYLLDCPEGQLPRRGAPSSIVGARSVYEIVDTSDMADLIGIVVVPGMLPHLVRDAADLFSNRGVDLTEVWGSPAATLRDSLRELAVPEDRLRWFEAFLTEKLSGNAAEVRSPRECAVRYALASFARAPRIRSVSEITRSLGWSERRFSQVFREEVGLTPKVWCRVRRFQRVVHELHAGYDIAWADLALDCGYYDQSHFANEFRAFSGVDATTYSARRTIWPNHIPAT